MALLEELLLNVHPILKLHLDVVLDAVWVAVCVADLVIVDVCVGVT